MERIQHFIKEARGKRKIVVVTGGESSIKSKLTSDLVYEFSNKYSLPIHSNLQTLQYKRLRTIDTLKEGVVLLGEAHTMSLNALDRVFKYTFNKGVLVIVSTYSLSQLPSKLRDMADIHLNVSSSLNAIKVVNLKTNDSDAVSLNVAS